MHIYIEETKPGLYHVYTEDGITLLEYITTPFLSAARKLIKQGVSPDAELTMFHKGSDLVSLRGTLGAASGWTVRETAEDGPHFKRYTAPSEVVARGVGRVPKIGFTLSRAPSVPHAREGVLGLPL
jgi:hypothetical protein